MERRTLGTAGLSVPPSAWAAWACRSSTAPPTSGALATIHRALELGIRCSTPRTSTGRARTKCWSARPSRDAATRVVIATKFGIVRDRRTQLARRSTAGRSTSRRCDGSPEAARRRHDRSLLSASRRSEHADRGDRRRDGRARGRGKVRYIGLSRGGAGDDSPRARRASDHGAADRVLAVHARPEDGLLATCRELGIGFVAYSPLGRGFLGGRIRSTTTSRTTISGGTRPASRASTSQRNLALVDRIEAIAAQKGCTAAQLGLAWVLAQGTDIVPIVGTKRRAYLEQNVAAVSLTLTDEDLRILDEAAPAWRSVGRSISDARACTLSRARSAGRRPPVAGGSPICSHSSAHSPLVCV